ncbi:hypothetical protein FCN80_15700 [Martelella alba]|uniref:Uncharacterized protein n=1 Tax=Martelella alba TaxID=2590451 RepID=A0ABY2SMU6_9HYPH|nr:hypothetical protein FCN80_15700 [Martelella alba]
MPHLPWRIPPIPSKWSSTLRRTIITDDVIGVDIGKAIIASVRSAGVPAAEIRAMCVSSLYGGSGIPVNKDMRPLQPCLIWMDRRFCARILPGIEF